MALKPMLPELKYRPLTQSDFPALKYLHERLFPISYDDNFYEAAVTGNGIVSFVAVADQASLTTRVPTSTTVFVNGQQLVGFITLKLFAVRDISAVDRHLLDLEGEESSLQMVAYILTLGVAEVICSL